jgi:hypothetical protein
LVVNVSAAKDVIPIVVAVDESAAVTEPPTVDIVTSLVATESASMDTLEVVDVVTAISRRRRSA